MAAVRPSPIRLILPFVFLLFVSVAAQAASYIVELQGEPAAMAAARARNRGTPLTTDQIEQHRATLRASQDRFLDSLRARGLAFQLAGQTVSGVRIDLRYTLVFNGVTLLLDPNTAATIAAMPEVKKVHADKVLKTSLDVSVPYIRAPHVYGAVKEVTKFDQLREGFEGQGVYISIIDSGVEWQHEMFGGDPTPPRLGVEPAVSGRNEKVVYYLPLADVVLEDGLGHGTHVAATAAGYQGFSTGPDGLPLTADDIPMHGVAPQARIMAYKVCSDALSIPGALGSPVGGCVTSNTVMALEDSMSPRTVNGFPKPVAHVINMSLGGAGTPDDASAVAADNAGRLGAVVVAAAGNDGPGEGTAGSPCVGRLVACIANSVDPYGSWSFDILTPSSVNKLIPGAVTPAASLPMANGLRQGIEIPPMSGSASPPATGVAQYYVYVAGGETPLSYPASVAGRIAIVRTSLQSTFGQVANSAAAAGAVAVIMRTDIANPTAVKATIPAAVLPIANFDYLVSLMNAGATPANGTLSTYPIRLNDYCSNTSMSGSSSRGPVVGYGQVKPDISAPGTNITAAVPPASLLGILSQGTYGSSSGTSMASPHVAGAAALVKQAHPTWNGDMIRTALSNTATNLRNLQGVPKADGLLAESIIDQGGGLIDVYEAVNIKALMGVTSDDPMLPTILGSHSFGEVPAINGRAIVNRTVRVTLRDLSGVAGTYTLAVANNRGLERPGISVSAPASVAVPANGLATFDVTATIDGSVVTTGDPLQIQWYVRAARQDGAETLSMPFYLRAVRTTPPPAVMNPIADDATPDVVDGVDRDGRYTVSWSYPAQQVAQPCGYRVEEARPITAASIWYDDGEELMPPGGNSRWVGADWSTRPHPGSLSLGYAAIYTDEKTASLTSANSIDLPAALVTLTFDSFEDIELDFDYGYVDVSTDDGATWTQAARYTGGFSGERVVDLSPFAGKPARLRFRLVADQLASTPAFQGWYIDNIRIRAGAAFNAIASVGSGSTSLSLGGKQDGLYAYRVTALFDNCASNPFVGTPSNIAQIEVSNATAPPSAVFTHGPNPSATGAKVSFNASGSADNDSVGGSPGITHYSWSFGDGGFDTGAQVNHIYTSPGTYRVVLTVTDNEGESAQSESMQTVQDPGPAGD